MRSVINRPEAAPFTLVVGSDCLYVCRETGTEIRLYRYSGEPDAPPEKVRLEGADKHGNAKILSLRTLYDKYTQKEQLDFTDPVDPRLPYVFDLFFDIKTISDLKRYVREEGMNEDLEFMMKDHDVSL